MDIPATFANSSRSTVYAIAPFLAIAIALAAIRLYTTWNYYRGVRYFLDAPSKPGKKLLYPVQIPYTLPWLGNTTSFLNTKPGQYWDELFSWHPRSTGACTLLIGGRKTHILFSPHAVSALFKDRTLKRDVFEHQLYQKVFVMPDEQIQNVEAGEYTKRQSLESIS